MAKSKVTSDPKENQGTVGLDENFFELASAEDLIEVWNIYLLLLQSVSYCCKKKGQSVTNSAISRNSFTPLIAKMDYLKANISMHLELRKAAADPGYETIAFC